MPSPRTRRKSNRQARLSVLVTATSSSSPEKSVDDGKCVDDLAHDDDQPLATRMQDDGGNDDDDDDDKDEGSLEDENSGSDEDFVPMDNIKNDDDEDVDDNVESGPRRRSNSTKATTRPQRTSASTRKSPRRPSKKDESSDESEEEDGTPKTQSTAASRRASSVMKSARKALAILDSSEEESSSDSEDEAIAKAASGSRKAKTPSRATPSRSAKKRSTRSPPKGRRPRPSNRRRRSKTADSDDEFVCESDEDDDRDDSDANIDHDDDDVDDDLSATKSKTIGLVKEGEVGSADEDSDDNNGSPLYRSPQLNVQRSTSSSIQRNGRSRMGSNPFHDESDESSTNLARPASTSSKGHRSPQAACARCPSRRDVVTEEDLPTMHVCFFPPDGQDRQCFSLETLRKIALSAELPRFRTDQTGANRQTFLQPPHFRTSMSDELLDQIASRFGRDALDIHGPFYTRPKVPERPFEAFQDTVTSAASTISDTFMQQLERYVKNRMGHQDLYCCPLCYIVAHKQLATHSIEDNSNDDRRVKKKPIDELYSTDFSYDPMTVLGYLDNDGFGIASTFCFTKVAVLKDHLRRDHSVDTKKIQGNDAYARYKIRAQDGLLQRYLTKNSGRFGTTRQGAMLSYWFHGNNSSFVLLLSLVSHAALCRTVVATSNDETDAKELDTANAYVLPAVEFFESFADEAKAIWDMVASPFSKATKEEINDFLVNDDEEEEEEEVEVSYQALHRAMNMEAELEDLRHAQDEADELVARYESLDRQRDMDDDDEEGDEEEEEEGDSTDENESGIGSRDDVANGGNFYESPEEVDEWERSIMSKRVARPRSQSPRKHRRTSRSPAAPSGSSTSQPATSNEPGSANAPIELDNLSKPKSSRRKSMAILDSDDD